MQIIYKYGLKEKTKIWAIVLVVFIGAWLAVLYYCYSKDNYGIAIENIVLVLLCGLVSFLRHRRYPRYIAVDGQNLIFKCAVGKKVLPIADVESIQEADYVLYGAKKDRPVTFSQESYPYAGFCQKGTDNKYWICTERRDGHALAVTKTGEKYVFDCDDIDELKKLLNK